VGESSAACSRPAGTGRCRAGRRGDRLGLRFRPSPDVVAWRRGAAGERRTARLLDPLEREGWAVLHDLAVPGSRANIDHLVIGPGGVFVIDSKQYRGRLQLDSSGCLWHGRYPRASTLRAVSFEADQAALILTDPDVVVVVVPIVAVHGAQVPWGRVVVNGVPVVAARLPRRRLTGNASPLDPPLPRGNHPVWVMPPAGFPRSHEPAGPLWEQCRAAGALQPAVGHG